MIISVLYGSTRQNRQGVKAALFITEQIRQRGHQVHLIDARHVDFPMLDLMYKEYDKGQAPDILQSVHEQLEESDGFVLVSGEYNHSIPPALKNLVDHYQSEYHFKPSALVTYSAGPFGGVRVGPHLRAITGELGMISIPTMLPISRVGKSFDDEGNPLDQAYFRRAERFLDEFDWYLKAFKSEREQGS